MLSRQAKGRVFWSSAIFAALTCGAAAAWTLLRMSDRSAAAVAAVTVPTVLLCLAGMLRLWRTADAARAAGERARALASARAAEVEHLASQRLPVILERARGGRGLDGAPGPLAPASETGERFTEALETLVQALGSDEAARRERTLRDSVQAAFESVARNMHAMSTVQQQVLDGVERLINDPAVMAEVMKADHAAAQMTRKAQTLLVMCGIWPARRENQPVPLFDCVRGAQSRIVEFGRVEIHGGQHLYVVPPAVEGMMHAVAELLENATVFSPSGTQVVVTVREVAAGAVVEIDDAGLGMPPDVLDQALAQLRQEADLAQLGAVPRLGLACVGRWSRELGFGVELSAASAYGGTRVVVFVPHQLLTEPWDDHRGSVYSGGRRPAAAAGTDRFGGTADRRPSSPTAAPPAPPAAPTTSPRIPSTPSTPSAPPASAPAPAGAAGDDPSAAPPLPRRRSRRRTTRAPASAAGSVGAGPAPDRQDADDVRQPAAPPWTPEAARASVASVVSGIRRGRAQTDTSRETAPSDAGGGPADEPDQEGAP